MRKPAPFRREIADGATAVAEKLIGREIDSKDQKNLIDSFIDELDTGDGK